MKNQITRIQASKMSQDDVARVCNTLFIAGDMLQQISEGKSFPAKIYMENMHAIRAVVFDIIPNNGQ